MLRLVELPVDALWLSLGTNNNRGCLGGAQVPALTAREPLPWPLLSAQERSGPVGFHGHMFRQFLN